MSLIKYLRVDGLWDCKDIEINFNEDLNFIIGDNGAGKTTVVNLMTSAIFVDIETLMSINFSSLIMAVGNDIVINISKSDDDDGEYLMFDVFKDGRNSLFKINDGDPESVKNRKASFIKQSLRDVVKVSWLPINRKWSPKSQEFNFFTDNSLTPVDDKLKEVKDGLFKLFAEETQRFGHITRTFQKNIFQKLLEVPNEDDLFSYQKGLNIDKEKEQLAEIFDFMLEGRKNNHHEKLFNYYKTLSGALSKIDTEKLSISDIGIVFNAWRTKSLITDYDNLKDKKEAIFRARNEFIDTLNKMFAEKKEFFVSPKNDFSVRVRGREIPLSKLSSGEKQMVILLGEAFLQKKAKIVYIADEPEISLHIKWQERLVDAISSINKNAQIIFATHSPDIVGRRTSNIIKMK